LYGCFFLILNSTLLYAGAFLSSLPFGCPLDLLCAWSISSVFPFALVARGVQLARGVAGLKSAFGDEPPYLDPRAESIDSKLSCDSVASLDALEDGGSTEGLNVFLK